ncbi:MAG: hypothetical protein WC603_01285 [Candidatus Paceibacterota bacterium]|jgi:hypothetical protein
MKTKDTAPIRTSTKIQEKIDAELKIIEEQNERKDVNEKIAKPLREKKAKVQGSEKKKLVKKTAMNKDTSPVVGVGDLNKDGTKKLDDTGAKDANKKIDKQAEVARLKEELEKAVQEAKYAKGSEQKVIDIQNRIRELEIEIQKEKEKNQVDDVKKDLNKTFQTQEEEKQNKIILEKLKTIGLTENDFAGSKEWQTFSTGEKLLIVEQLAQETLSHVKEIGEKRFQQKNKINFSWNPTKWAPLSVLNKIKNNVIKAYWISKAEKQVIEEARLGKIKPSEQSIKMMMERTADMHLNVVEKDGRAIIEFVPIDKNLPEEQQKIIQEYNKVANEFARMPDSWRNEKAANSKDTGFHKKNYENFMRVKASYEKAKASLLKISEGKYLQSGITEKEASGKAMLEIKNYDGYIAIIQRVNTNPDVIGELDRIRNESSVKRLFNNENLWRAGYMAVGFGARSLTVSTLGLLAAPIVGGAIGGARARRKANEKINLAFSKGLEAETFRERRETGKKGLFDDKDKNRNLLSKTLGGYNVDSKEVGAFVDADSQIQRLDNIISKIDQAKNGADKLSLKDQLYARIKYVEDKHEFGLINYGTQNVVGSNYELFKKLSEARAQLAVFDFIDTQKKLGAHDKRTELLYKIMKDNEVRLDKTQANFKNQETLRGAMVAGGFALLGWQIRDWMSGGEEEIANNLDSEFSDPLGRTLPGQDEITPIDKVVEHASVEATADHGQGAISTIRELQDNLKVEYGSDLDNAPASVQQIINTDADKLAQEYGMYKPGQDAESALDLKSIKVDGETGDITYQTMRSEADIKVSSNYEGKMIDTDNSGVKIESTDTEDIIAEREPVNISRMESIDDAQVSTEVIERGTPEIVDIDNPDQDAGPGEIKGDDVVEASGLSTEELAEVSQTYKQNINHLFSTKEQQPGGVWDKIQGKTSAEKLMEMGAENKISPEYKPLTDYMKKLEETSELKPRGITPLNPEPETIPEYMNRALQKIQQDGRLDEIKLSGNEIIDQQTPEGANSPLPETEKTIISESELAAWGIREVNIDSLKDLKELTEGYEGFPTQPPLSMIMENIEGKGLHAYVTESVGETKAGAQFASSTKMYSAFYGRGIQSGGEYEFFKTLPNGNVKSLIIRFYK